MKKLYSPWQILVAAMILMTLFGLLGGYTVTADHTLVPAGVAVVGSLQDELGCPGDWQPDCAATELVYDGSDDVWQGIFSVPAGNWEYKAALNDSWDENYGANAQQNGANISLNLPAQTDIKFYYDHKSHWITDSYNAEIATAPGSYQSELGCPGDWQPDCLLSWLQDPDGDGIYNFSTNSIQAGDYDFKVAIDENWTENYGAGGAAGGNDIPFTVPVDGATVTFTWDATTKVPTVEVTSGGLEPGDAALVSAPVRQAGAGEVIYFVMTDRFANGDSGNDTAGLTVGDRLVDGYDPTDKGFYHGGDLAGLSMQLDYLQGLGVTALWVTPPFENRWVQGAGTSDVSAGYHGYWQIDLTTIDPHLGSNAEMQALVAAAHARGMKVYFDIVANHTGDVVQYVGGGTDYRSKTDYPYRDAAGIPFDDRDYAGTATFPPLDPAVSFPYEPIFATPEDASVKAPDFLNDPTLYHNRGNSTFAGENSLYGDFFGLDDLFTEHPAVVDGMIAAHQAMITTFGIDGFRVDTAKHVNDEFWEAFIPAVRQHAAAEGNPDFVVFGEVFSGEADYASRFSTELPFPGTLDFRFDGAVKGVVAYNGATDGLRTLFLADDWFTDDDSNAYGLVKFVGNHDLGRVGRDIDLGNPGAADSERVARARLVQALNFTTRGAPVLYYGDEQGFTGDGGDKDARQDMFPSQVASYNDDDLIGTAATTADDNFDSTHPLYLAISELAQLRTAHPTLVTGAQLHRYSEGVAGIYAFSRLDRVEKVEYLVAVNTSESAAAATFTSDSPAVTFSEVFPGGGPSISSDSSGTVTVDVPALDIVVYRADQPVPTDTTPDGIAIAAPVSGAEVLGRTEVRADVTPGTYAEVTFAVAIDGGPYEVIGTDDNAPYAVYHDVSGLPAGTSVTYKAIVADLGGNLNAAKVTVAVAEPPPPTGGTAPYAIVHYVRTDGDYGDHTTGDFNDYWGLHLWGDIEETIDWTAPKPFLGEDEYGRFAWVKLIPGAQNVGFIVHRGDTKDGTQADRFFDPSTDGPEIWLKNDDANFYTSQAEAQGYVTVRYHRPDGDYGDPTSLDYNDFWGLHLWGSAIDPAEATGWTTPKPFDGVDDYGAFWQIAIQDASQPLNFIIHRGDTKDPGPDESFIPQEVATAWKQSGDVAIYPSRAAAENYARLHYHRADGDYGDPTSQNFNDFWGLHVWDGAASPNPSWQDPVRPTGFDTFGPYFEVALQTGADQLAYILHRGDTKDPGSDQFLVLGEYGHEVWQLEGDGPDPAKPHYVLPVVGISAAPGDLSKQKAHWVAADRIAWAIAGDPAADYWLCYAPDGGMVLDAAGITGGSCLMLDLAPPFPAGVDGFRHLAGMSTLSIASGDLVLVPDILKGQVALLAIKGGVRVDATGLQIPGVLDDLYNYSGELGVSWDGNVPTLRVWAPTAKSVALHLFNDSDPATSSTIMPMNLDPATGVWSLSGDSSWKDKYYLYEVEVYVNSTGQVEHNLVTDPYSFSLAMNSSRSQIVDLSDPALKPAGWDVLEKPALPVPEDISIYEIHVRDFSVNDPSVPEDLKGTYKAFTLEDTYGVDHLEALRAAGLSHLHLLPAFDIATINENKPEWQQPDPAVLATYPPDSDQQQAAVAATADLDGFNWGYDPWHYTTPEGSYSTNPDGPTRIIEFREMVQALNELGLRVVMDVVYNHTNSSGQAEKSVLDRIVPGYYHRLNDQGQVETSTCCQNTASEHKMMEKLMVDSLVTWATQYKVDAFRFDLMGHHSLANMLEVQANFNALTPANDGVDGSEIYIYGEGWNFGEVADNARFIQATQLNLGGSGIGSFSDRLRDAVRGGGPFDSGQDLIRRQGFANGLYYDPNALNTTVVPAPEPGSVTIAGDLQSELGCPGDWQPDCAATYLNYDAGDTIWQGLYTVPAGGWNYKAALNNSWDENYGANAERDGPNISLNLSSDAAVKFYYSHITHWVADNVNKVIATVPGSFQDELGCSSDWQPDCLRSWLQDPDGDGIYSFSTSDIPAGNYEAKVAIDENWTENYGAGGVQNGPNIVFDVAAGQTVTFSYDPVSHVLSISYTASNQLAELLLLSDQIRVGMAGNLASYTFIDRNGNLVTGAEVDYNGQPAGYTQDPQEDITYISKHDNQTLYDNNVYKVPLGTSMTDRVRIQNVGLSTVLLGQGVPFMHAGSDLLRSKSLDRDSYNSGDWFNKLDFTYQDNNFGAGLPVAGVNQDNWPIMAPLLANPELKPTAADIEFSAALYQELLQIRYSSALFRLQTGAEIQARVAFHNTGPGQLPGLIAMSIDDHNGTDLDPRHEAIYVLINANDEPQTIMIAELAGVKMSLHPVQMASFDPLVKTAAYNETTGAITVPGRTTTVFVELAPAQERISYLIDDVEALVAGGSLNDGQGNSLIGKLLGAIEKLDASQPHVAINRLNAFINEVMSLIDEGVLTAEQGKPLIDVAADIIWQIQTGF